MYHKQTNPNQPGWARLPSERKTFVCKRLRIARVDPEGPVKKLFYETKPNPSVAASLSFALATPDRTPHRPRTASGMPVQLPPETGYDAGHGGFDPGTRVGGDADDGGIAGIVIGRHGHERGNQSPRH